MKRVFDVVVATLVLLAASPLLLAAMIGVLVFLGWPVFFVQQRPGLKGRPFGMIKLRTMHDTRGADGQLLPDEQRLGSFGRLLRATSLDELPEMLNVLKGDMSMVGPRPLLFEYLPLYSAEQARRHEVQPGITGWAQVNGRNAMNWDQRLAMDVWYVDNHSLWLDLKILAKTVIAVVSGHGVRHDGHATMPKFRGGSDKP